MADPNLLLSQLLAPVFAGHDPVVRPSERADYQANGVLAMAKAVSRNPRDLAAELLPLAAEALAGLATVEVAGPGFLNLTLTDEFLAAQVAQLATPSANISMPASRVCGLGPGYLYKLSSTESGSLPASSASFLALS